MFPCPGAKRIDPVEFTDSVLVFKCLNLKQANCLAKLFGTLFRICPSSVIDSPWHPCLGVTLNCSIGSIPAYLTFLSATLARTLAFFLQV